MSLARAGMPVAAGWQWRRSVLAALAVSLALNLLFVAGAVWTQVQPPAPRGLEQRLQRVGAELDLSPAQQADLDHLLAEMRSRGVKLQQDVLPVYAAAWQEAGQPNADTDKILRLFDEASDKRQEISRKAIASMIAFMKKLSPEQRAKFISLVRERRPRGR